MNDLERAVRASKQIEARLERQFGARGKGLHEKVSSVERSLPAALVKRIRYVATLRNKLVHEDNYHRLDDRASFKRAVKTIQQEFRKMDKSPFPWGLAIVSTLVVAIFVAIALLFLGLV
ncbi:MAG: DUF4145 domain-containing protein [Gammaproteobacteria bacterium]|nr:DUF4145 domain-containing protein [Gammaproteobacteria bacterium]